MSIDISKFAKLLHEYVDTYVKYKDADNTEKIRLWLLLSDEAKELFLYFSKLQKDNDALKRRIETLQIYADDYWERLKAHRKITRSLNARIDELEGAIEILEDQQRETKNILIDKNLHIDSLYEEGYKMQQRIADLEARAEKAEAMVEKLIEAGRMMKQPETIEEFHRGRRDYNALVAEWKESRE